MNSSKKQLSIAFSSLLLATTNLSAQEATLDPRYCTAEEKAIAIQKAKSTAPLETLSGPMEVALEYYKGEQYLLGSYAPGYKLSLKAEKLEGVAGNEHLVSDPIAEANGVKIAVAKSDGSELYDLMYIDHNLDGKFSDEAAISMEIKDRGNYKQSSSKVTSVKINHKLEDGTMVEAYADLNFWMTSEDGATPDSIRYSNKTASTAKVTLEGVEYDLVIQDFSNNFMLNDVTRDYWMLKNSSTTPAFKQSGKLSRYLYSSKGKAWRIEVTDPSGLKADIYEIKPHMTPREIKIIDGRIREKNPDLTAPLAKEPITFETDLATALKKAKELNTSCFVKFETTWCGPCKFLNSTVFNKQETADAAKNVVCIKIDGDKHRDLVKKYNVKGYPTMMMLDSNGEIVETYRGARSIKAISAFLKSGKK